MSTFEVLGWVGNAAFFSRFLVQWWASERAGRSVAPASFWWISLAGSASLGAYSLQRGEPVLLFGYLVNAGLYVRNLWLTRRGRREGARFSSRSRLCAALLVAALVAASARVRSDPGSDLTWFACALLGQGLWSSRFVLQWWASERAGASRFPPSFWWISLAGNTLLLAYAAHLRDPIYMAGFALGPLVQARNLWLSRPRPALR